MNVSVEDRIVVFAGPSLPRERRPVDPVFAWRPPAAAGDAYRLAGRCPRSVVLIDGLFDEQPAIRHKELLSLIAEGVPVIGGASMGALRAAELHVHGMMGVGSIFEAFARGQLEGDDEVAVLHGPAQWAWAPLTEPLVNVRATLLAAVRQRVIPVAAARVMLCVAMDTYYKERTWPQMMGALAGDATLSPVSLAAFEHWLPGGQVDLKQADALLCLSFARAVEMRSLAPNPPETLFTIDLRNWVTRTARTSATSTALGPGSDPSFL